MKVVATKTFGRNETAPLPLVPIEYKYDTKDSTKSSSFKLRTVPAEATSPTYSFTTPVVDGTQSIRVTMEWMRNIDKVCTGLDITDVEHKHTIVVALLRGAALTAFTTKTEESRDALWKTQRDAAFAAVVPAVPGLGPPETPLQLLARRTAALDAVVRPARRQEDISEGLKAVVAHVCPYKVLQKQKRIMRRNMRKPADMRIRTYVNHMLRIIREELQLLPPFRINQSFEEDEVKEIIAFSIPARWSKEMDRLDYDIFGKTIEETVCFCERQEEAESGDFTKVEHPKHGSHKKKGKFERAKKEGGKWCDFHETDTHNTSECTTLQNLKKKGKSNHDNKEKFKNKTWKRKFDDAKSYSKKEINALLKKEVAKAFKTKKEVNVLGKRKSDSDDDDDEASVESNSSNSSNSINVMEERMKDCDHHLGDLTIDKKSGTDSDDDEISV